MGDLFMFNKLQDQLGAAVDSETYGYRLNLDDLYDKHRQTYEQKRTLYNKVLRLIHRKITMSAKYQAYCSYDVPEYILGAPKYNVSECIGHVLTELEANKFLVRYIHPNQVFITWGHWVPTYERQQVKSRFKININEYGQVVEEDTDGAEGDGEDNPAADYVISRGGGGHQSGAMFISSSGKSTGMEPRKPTKQFKPVQAYKPRGVYNDELLNKLGDKL